MAVLRYTLRKQLGETSIDGMGIYKIVKASILKRFAEARLPYLTDPLLQEIQLRLKEIDFQNQLWSLSQSEQRWSAAQDLVARAMQKCGITPLQKNKELSIFAKYFILERNLRLLAKQQERRSSHHELGELTPFYELLVEKRAIRCTRHLAALKQAREKQEIKKLYSLFVTGDRNQLPNSAWLEEDFSKDPTFWRSLVQKEEAVGKKLYAKMSAMIPHLLTTQN